LRLTKSTAVWWVTRVYLTWYATSQHLDVRALPAVTSHASAAIWGSFGHNTVIRNHFQREENSTPWVGHGFFPPLIQNVRWDILGLSLVLAAASYGWWFGWLGN